MPGHLGKTVVLFGLQHSLISDAASNGIARLLRLLKRG